MMSDPVYTFYVVCAAIAAFVGLIFNGYILFVLLCSSVTANNILLLFMALADTILCLVILICNTSLGFLQEVPVYGPDSVEVLQSDQLVCKVEGVLWTVLPLAIIWTICGLIIDRYIAIIKPLNYNRIVNVRRATLSLIICWLFCTCFAFPPLFGYCQFQFSSSHSSCITICPNVETDLAQFSYLVLYFTAVLFPIIFIFICNTHILLIARNQRHRIVSAIYEITIRAQATVTHQRSPNYLLKYKGRDAFFTISQLVGSLGFLTIPYFVIYAYKSFIDNKFDDYWASAATVLLSLTPLVNAYMYGVKSKALRKTFKRLLQRYLYKQQASIEIDRRLSLRSQSSLREGWNSLFSSSTLSSNVYRSHRRFSAPLATNFSHGPAEDTSSKQFVRSLAIFNTSHLKPKFESRCCTMNGLTRRPSFLAETKILNTKIALSPIQEISQNGLSEHSSITITSD